MNHLFKIFRINTKKPEAKSTLALKNFQNDFEELIIGIEGKIKYFVDFNSNIIEAPFVGFISKGQLHRIRADLEDNYLDMWVLRFKSEFIAETVFQLYGSFHNNSVQVLQRGSCFDRLNNICKMICEEMKQTNPDLSIVRHLLSALIIMIDSEKKKAQLKEESINFIQNETFINFLKILEENFRRPLGVDFYAEKLFMSSRNLNLICQKVMNQSVSEIIETRKLTEAKNLLISSNKSISEIAFELGYNENSYFSNVFKKKSGQTPSEFREEIQKLFS